MKKLILAVTAFAMMTACTNETKKALVLYYSQTGATKVVAEQFQQQLGADIEAFDVLEVYDGTYEETIARCQKERAEGYIPTYVPVSSDLSEYDVIFLGYPIWFGTYAPPVAALLDNLDLSGKTVVPFCTFGSGGLETSVADLAKALPNSVIASGYGVRNARISSAPLEVERFLIANGYKEGIVEVFDDYSVPRQVTEEEKAIFDAACSSYQYPLGTPVTVGHRTTSYGTDYIFTADSANGVSTIYVTVVDGAEPEFTKVVR